MNFDLYLHTNYQVGHVANEGTKGQHCKECNQHGLAGLKICEPDDPAEPPLGFTSLILFVNRNATCT